MMCLEKTNYSTKERTAYVNGNKGSYRYFNWFTYEFWRFDLGRLIRIDVFENCFGFPHQVLISPLLDQGPIYRLSPLR